MYTRTAGLLPRPLARTLTLTLTPSHPQPLVPAPPAHGDPGGSVPPVCPTPCPHRANAILTVSLPCPPRVPSVPTTAPSPCSLLCRYHAHLVPPMVSPPLPLLCPCCAHPGCSRFGHLDRAPPCPGGTTGQGTWVTGVGMADKATDTPCRASTAPSCADSSQDARVMGSGGTAGGDPITTSSLPASSPP